MNHYPNYDLPAINEELRKIPGVVAVGLGRHKGQFQWRVYVRETEFEISIPKFYCGYQTVAISHKAGQFTAGHPVLTPGAQIESITKGGEGTLGCFARYTPDNRIVILSNSHVLFGDTIDTEGPFETYYPTAGTTCCRGWEVGKTIGRYTNSNHLISSSYMLDGSRITEKGSDVDCAISAVSSDVSFTNNIPQIGMISGTPAAGTLGVKSGDVVSKFGITSGLTSGKIADLSHLLGQDSSGQPLPPEICPARIAGGLDDELAGAFPNINFFVVIPDNGKTDFVRPGDSGSVVVNSSLQVIGLVFRQITMGPETREFFKLTDPSYNNIKTLGAVCPIGPILTRMQIQIPPNFTRTVPAADTSVEWQDRVRYMTALEKLQENFSHGRNSKLFLLLLMRHRVECTKFILHNREAGMLWQRFQGPSFIAHFIKNVEDSNHVIPSVINGISQRKVLFRLKELFIEYGSENLKKDITRFGGRLFDEFPGIENVWEVPELLEKENWLLNPVIAEKHS